jgi:hypothetical protein
VNPFAIYFPQFHPTRTNDAAWGHGFTDWSLVAQANLRPSWQRRSPRRGYYDGSDPAVHRAQVGEIAQRGLGGVALYHYWFYSHQELPAFEHSLLNGATDDQLPWFLIWATESWSRRWIGDPTPILSLDDRPSVDAIAAHCEHITRCFERPGYQRWRGKPLFVWYNLGHFAEPARVLEHYRVELRRRGHEVSFGHFVKNPADRALANLVDLNYLFEPRLYFGFNRVGRGQSAKGLFDLAQSLLGKELMSRSLVWLDRFQQKGQVHAASDYLSYLASDARRAFAQSLGTPVQDVMSPGWNNTPRYGDRFTALESLTPDDFAREVAGRSAGNDVPLLINAWNEWSEGAAIEPCQYLGDRYLAALHKAGVISST